MNPNNLFIISDIHGQIEQFKTLLSFWDKHTQQLVLAGDLIDRGKHSADVVRLAMELKYQHQAIVLMGNHEELLLSWLDDPNETYAPDSVSTIISFVNEIGEFYWARHLPEVSRKALLSRFSDEMDFLRTMTHYHETDNHIIVHAGVDLDLLDWHETSTIDMHWIRDEFHKAENKTGKTIVFGHTPTKTLHHHLAVDNSVWVSPCKTKIGIDGGSYFGGFLHGLSIVDGKHQVFSVKKDLSVETTELTELEKGV